jgi:outer membrane receptor protein involved in Fe transport
VLSIFFILSMLGGQPVQAGVPGVMVSGVVQDQTGAVLAGARVDLVGVAGTVVQSVAADEVGVFHLDRVPPGTYELRARFEGFKESSTRLRVAARPPAPQKLVLELAKIAQEVTVSNLAAGVSANSASNRDALTIDREMLGTLPMLDRDLIATMSRFLDPSALGTGGVTIVVNGMEVNALNVSASAVAQIRLNQDPYSAEYSRPGRGRIEILTKPGSQQYHGEFNTLFRDAAVDARNAFATSTPQEQRETIEGFLGGPLGHSGKTMFMLSASDDHNANQAFIHAIGPSGVIDDQLSQTSGRALITGSITHQVSLKNTFSIRPNYQYERDENRDAGGTTLASAATTFKHHEQQVTFTQQTMVRPTLVNQFQFLLGHEREPSTSRTPDRGIVVSGAFTGGGGQVDLVRTETHINLNESLAWIHGHHLIQAGFQLPDWSRRGFNDRTDFGGTFYFANLETYTAGTPYAFTQQRGNGDLALLEKQVGIYIKDDWQIRPDLSVDYGLRYDWQNYFHDNNNVAPRFSAAYAPGGKKTNVFRAGIGVFNDRSGPVVIADVLHSQPGGLTRFVITNPGYPDPFASAAANAQPPSIVRLAPGVQIPQTVQYSASVDHQVRKTTTVSLTYTGARGFHLFRSRDVNAPLPPLYVARPAPAFGAVRQVESTGRQSADSLGVTVRGRVTAWFNGQMQYALSRTDNDTGGIAAFPANDYDLSGEWARADFDRRHRFVLIGRVTAVKAIDLGVALTLNSAGPYTETVGGDPYNNGRGHARPAGIARNTLSAGDFSTLDLHASRELKSHAAKAERSLTLGVDAFNLLNRVNYGSYIGTAGSPLFALPVSARPARQFQFSARYKF